jgi:hypothetical protein
MHRAFPDLTYVLLVSTQCPATLPASKPALRRRSGVSPEQCRRVGPAIDRFEPAPCWFESASGEVERPGAAVARNPSIAEGAAPVLGCRVGSAPAQEERCLPTEFF